MELVIAISLAVVLLLIVFAAMRLGYKSRETGTRAAEISQRMRILGDRVSWLIRGAYPYLVTKPDGKKLYFSGADEQAGFVTSSVDSPARGPEDAAGLKWVSLFVDRKGLQVREKVFFMEDVFDDDGGAVTVLDPSVTKIAFAYLDANDDNLDGEWVDTWNPDEKDYLPSAVKVSIVFELNGKKIEMPEMIVTIQATRKMVKQGPT